MGRTQTQSKISIFFLLRKLIAKMLILIVICSTGMMKLGTNQQKQRDISSIFNMAGDMPGSPRTTGSGGGSGSDGGSDDGGNNGPNNDMNRRRRKEAGDLAAAAEEDELDAS